MKKALSILLLTVAFVFAHSQVLNAQEDTTLLKTNGQVWLDYTGHLYLTGKLQFYADAGLRVLVSDLQWLMLYGRPAVRYHINSTFVAHSGLGAFMELNKELGNRFEIRPFQALQIKWPHVFRWYFSHRVQFEERVNHLFINDVTQFEFRMRFKLGGRYQFKPLRNGDSFFIPFSAEWFLPVSQRVDELFSNNVRFTTGFGYNATELLQFRLNAIWQRSKAGSTDNFNLSDFVVRLQAFYSLDRVISTDEIN